MFLQLCFRYIYLRYFYKIVKLRLDLKVSKVLIKLGRIKNLLIILALSLYLT
jgi:hypothetical protein